MTQAYDALIEIRPERTGDIAAIAGVHRHAFFQEQEGRIVDALRAHGAIALSLVAVCEDSVVGHVMFSPATVGSLIGAALGPMSVHPGFQRRGIGSQLVERGLEQLRAGGCPFVVVIGHPAFYPRFGFRSAAAYGLTCGWDVPAEAFMIAVLDSAATSGLAGLASFRAEFSAVE